MLNLRITCFSVLLLLGLSANAAEYAVVVNGANGYSDSESNMKQEIKLLYLKQKSEWDNKLKAKPVAPVSGSKQSSAFLSSVLGMSSAQVAQHWLRTKQVSGQTPPRELKSTMAVKLVQRGEGAFAVIDSGAAASLPENTKVLFEF